jgi:hypothetical protein
LSGGGLFALSVRQRDKAAVRAKAVMTIDDLWKAIGHICCDLFNPGECKNYITAAWYGLT